MNLDSLARLERKLKRREETTLVGSERGLALMGLRWGSDKLDEADATTARELVEAVEDFPEVALGPTDSRFLAKVLGACVRARLSDLCQLRYRIEGAAQALRKIEEMRGACDPNSPEAEVGEAAAEKTRAVIRDLVRLTLSTAADAASLDDRRAILRLSEEALGSGDALVAEVRLVVAYEARLQAQPADKPSILHLPQPAATPLPCRTVCSGAH